MDGLIMQKLFLRLPVLLGFFLFLIKFYDNLKRIVAGEDLLSWSSSLLYSLYIILLLALGIGLAKLYKLKKSYFYLALVILAIVPRVVWIIAFPTHPTSDFYLYHLIASYRADENSWSILYDKDLLNYSPFFTHILSFSTVLSWVYQIFGKSVFSGQFFNILATLVGSIYFFKANFILSNRYVASIATMFFLFSPAYFMYSTLIVTEPLFMCLIAIAIYFWVLLYKSPEPNWILSIGVGFSMVGANLIRPSGFLISLVFVASMMICSKKIILSLKKIIPGMLIFLAFSIATPIINKVVYPFPTASTSAGYGVYVGANESSSGTWTEEDKDYFWELYNDLPVNEVSSVMMKAGIDRWVNIYKEGRLISYLVTKFKIFSDDSYGYNWTIYNDPENFPLNSRSQFTGFSYFVDSFLLIMSFLACALALLLRKTKKIYLFIVLEFGYTLGSLLIEVQGRYHVPLLFVSTTLTGFSCFYLYKLVTSKGSLLKSSKLKGKAKKTKRNHVFFL